MCSGEQKTTPPQPSTRGAHLAPPPRSWLKSATTAALSTFGGEAFRCASGSCAACGADSDVDRGTAKLIDAEARDTRLLGRVLAFLIGAQNPQTVATPAVGNSQALRTLVRKPLPIAPG
jgi:hypothetical protein